MFLHSSYSEVCAGEGWEKSKKCQIQPCRMAAAGIRLCFLLPLQVSLHSFTFYSTQDCFLWGTASLFVLHLQSTCVLWNKCTIWLNKISRVFDEILSYKAWQYVLEWTRSSACKTYTADTEVNSCGNHPLCTTYKALCSNTTGHELMQNIPVGVSGKQHGIWASQLSLNNKVMMDMDLVSKFLIY